MTSLFSLRQRVVELYSAYVQGFLNFADPRIEEFVRRELMEKGHLWPEPLLQLAANYAPDLSVDDLVAQNLLHPLIPQIVRLNQPLYAHQSEAIKLGLRGESFVITSGTGSGKSLTYWIPILHHILSHAPEMGATRAILVYPTNALVNSQRDTLVQWKEAFGAQFPITFARYTGQESMEKKERIRSEPPHILLTNYVMLELMLTRPKEALFVDRLRSKLAFLVVDELHSYRGRQGADMALLIRRVRQRCGNPNLICIGTSATMATEGGPAARREAVARFATRIFGVPIPPENVIEEEVERRYPRAPSPEELHEAVRSSSPKGREVLGAWLEDRFGIRAEGEVLRAGRPFTLTEAARRLAQELGIDPSVARAALEAFVSQRDEGSPAAGPALRFHQFLSQGGALWATLEPRAIREFAPGGGPLALGARGRVLFPLKFCRECGQEYYHVEYDPSQGKVIPWLGDPQLDEEEAGFSSTEGYLLLDEEGLWTGREEDLPEEWVREGRVRREYRDNVPQPLYAAPDGQVQPLEGSGTVPVWFIRKPFLFCPRCGIVYNRKVDEFTKLGSLSSEGRSTATTLVTLATIAEMRRSGYARSAAKVLSFTDNRQDASLQTGHLNDFVQVALLRAALLRALEREGLLEYSTFAQRVEAALELDQELFAREPGRFADAEELNRKALRELIEYRLLADLRRGWRITLPNLEQCGLLRIRYRGLDALVADEEAWRDVPVLAEASPERRAEAIRALLDHFRWQLAVEAPCLLPESQEALRKKVNTSLKEPWTFDERERLLGASAFRYPDAPRDDRFPDRSLSERSALGRYLSAASTWGRTTDLPPKEYVNLARHLVTILRGSGLLVEVPGRGGPRLRLRVDALLWEKGDGETPVRDPVRSRWLPGGRREVPPRVNTFFRDFYRSWAADLRGIVAKEHTAQISYDERREREEAFREGKVAALFCSPTMELGIDIGDLNLVHLRNAPRTPANYAQRSGRAGRTKGQDALILTYCASGSAHDQYFFARREELVAGVVVPPRIDLTNEDLLRSHVHAMWLAATGLDLGQSVDDVLDRVDPRFPLRPEVRAHLDLPERRLQALVEEAWLVLTQGNEALQEEPWFTREWVAGVVRSSSSDFDRAFDRWRELYRQAMSQQNQANEEILVRSRDRHAHKRAEWLRAEAERQLQLLLNQTGRTEESDFYPYRYLASEGFLPGYNFPRLPVRAYLYRREEGQHLARPRFLALTEFGPHNLIYHDGAKFMVSRAFLTPGEDEARLVPGKACRECGALYLGTGAQEIDLCTECKAQLVGDSVEFLPRLLEMPSVGTEQRERITCDEEERIRIGYQVTTHLRLDGGEHERWLRADAAWEDGKAALTYAPALPLVRVNHGWSRGIPQGFILDRATGEWLSEGEAGERTGEGVVSGVRLFVQDRRNALLIGFQPETPDEASLAALQYALQRGIETVYQLEPDELAGERVGRNPRRILLWEEAEGGAGVLRELVEDPGALARVARAALEICHFEPTTGSDLAAETCAAACYRCLLSYANQREHLYLDRHRALPWLLRLAKAAAHLRKAERSYEQQYRWLMSQVDPRSPLEAKFLEHLYRRGLRLPDYAQALLVDVAVRPDFYYERARACVFCDGAVHDLPAQRVEDERLRKELLSRGYRVVVVRYDRPIEEQISSYTDVFGSPAVGP